MKNKKDRIEEMKDLVLQYVSRRGLTEKRIKKKRKKNAINKKMRRRLRERILPDTNLWSEHIKKTSDHDVIKSARHIDTVVYSGHVDHELSNVRKDSEFKSSFEKFRKKMRAKRRVAYGSADKYSAMIKREFGTSE